MAKEKPKVQSILESLFVEAAEKLGAADDGRTVDRLFVQLDMSSGEIQVYDAGETLLSKNTIFDWANRLGKDADPYRQPIQSLRSILAGLKSKGFFGKPLFDLPFRVIFSDENFGEIETVYTVEDNVGKADEGALMKDLGRELKTFYRKLFADME